MIIKVLWQNRTETPYFWKNSWKKWIKIYENIPGYKEKVENFWIVAIKF